MGGVIHAAGAYTLEADIECSPFRALARAIAHQQLNGTAANTILTRFINTVRHERGVSDAAAGARRA